VSFKDERYAIESYFVAGWSNGVSRYLEGQPRNERSGSEFVVLLIRSGAGSHLYLNQDTHRYAGVVIIQIFTPLNQGTDRARDIADDAADIFRQSTTQAGSSGKIEFLTPFLTYPNMEGDWFRMNVNIPYRRDVTFP